MLALTHQVAGITLKTGVRIDTDKYKEILREAKADPTEARRGRALREHPPAVLARRRAPATAATAASVSSGSTFSPIVAPLFCSSSRPNT